MVQRKKRIAINGFGRIGRVLARIILSNPDRFDFELASINTPGDPESILYLLKYDSTHGVFNNELSLNGQQLISGNHAVALSSVAEIPPGFWEKKAIDYVLDCSGLCKDKASAAKHIQAGASKVLIASPAKGVDKTVVYGVNHLSIKPDDRVISCASCTTNCLAPIAAILDKAFNIQSGFMTTVHAYTNDQALIDRRHRDPRRGRAAAQSIVPTTTGAASAIGAVLPKLEGKLSGNALRVPTGNVSLLDLNLVLGSPVDPEAVVRCVKASAAGEFQRVVAINDQPLVSVDFLGHEASAIFDTTQVQSFGHMLKVVAWYDNEWGYASRMLDVAQFLQTVEHAYV